MYNLFHSSKKEISKSSGIKRKEKQEGCRNREWVEKLNINGLLVTIS